MNLDSLYNSYLIIWKWKNIEKGNVPFQNQHSNIREYIFIIQNFKKCKMAKAVFYLNRFQPVFLMKSLIINPTKLTQKHDWKHTLSIVTTDDQRYYAKKVLSNCYCLKKMFCLFFFEKGSYYVAQALLEKLSISLPRARHTGMHYPWDNSYSYPCFVDLNYSWKINIAINWIFK
jgi:hypothetical protein